MLKALQINSFSRKSDGHQRVLALLCDKVHTERRFLGMPYFTWWFEYGALEVFESLNGFVPRALWADWERFVEDSPPEFIAAIEEHDRAVEGLRLACQSLQRCLESSRELRQLYERCTQPEVLAELETDVKTLFGARPPENHLSYLAQLIVNATPADCSPLYTIRPLWMRFGEEFLALREKEVFRRDVEDVNAAADLLGKALGRLEGFCPPGFESSGSSIA